MEEVGKVLASKRIELQYSIVEVSQLLKIREKYLICIENGDLDKIPGEVYLKGYIKEYAKFLEINNFEQFEILAPKKTPQIIADDREKNTNNIAPNMMIVISSILAIFFLYFCYTRI